jgi:hypothetical protein
MTKRKKFEIVYWVTTLLFSTLMAWSAVQYLVEAPRMIETLTTHLGYPLYFTKLLGLAKLLGVAALLYPAYPRLKEWAYAGFAFDVIGAIVSHLSVGDSVLIAAVPFAFLVLLIVSYVSHRWLQHHPKPRHSPSNAPWGVPA